jgi:hypothetical protein
MELVQDSELHNVLEPRKVITTTGKCIVQWFSCFSPQSASPMSLDRFGASTDLRVLANGDLTTIVRRTVLGFDMVLQAGHT